ncbi:hypothetical protein [Deinococcus kurensis]|uniref:hypothetical protein n=1 Tax=Deinococcus kurensis TaxID=2662757 RepID=UPI0012D2D90E|nr:hypothetical protein [Deinococcus kurensis]
MELLSSRTATLDVLVRVEYVYDATTRRNRAVHIRQPLPATVNTYRAIGIWAERRHADTHLLEVELATFPNPNPAIHGPSDADGNVTVIWVTRDCLCRHHEVTARYVARDLDPTDRGVLDTRVTCEDCRAHLNLPQVKDPRHFIPLIDRAPKGPTKKDEKLARFHEKFMAKYGEAPVHYAAMQTSGNNPLLWSVKYLLECSLVKHDSELDHTLTGLGGYRGLPEKRLKPIMRALTDAVNLGGELAGLRAVQELLGVGVGFDSRRGGMGRVMTPDGKAEVIWLEQVMDREALQRLIDGA